MNTKKKKIELYNLKIDTIKKDIKNIHLGVYPPNGRVRVAAPKNTSDETIRLFLLSKLSWIKKQQSKFFNQERETKREYLTGESHYFFGDRYRLNIIESNQPPKIEITRKRYIDFYITNNTNSKQKEKMFNDFYRLELKKLLAKLSTKWGEKTGIEVSEVAIKKMKTKWGTCNPQAKRIWINLELAKKPIHCMEYVLLHEMIHMTENKHDEKFIKKMNSYMPQWEQYKQELNKSILSHNKW